MEDGNLGERRNVTFPVLKSLNLKGAGFSGSPTWTGGTRFDRETGTRQDLLPDSVTGLRRPVNCSLHL